MKIALTILFLTASLFLAKADDSDRSFTFDFGPAGQNQALPSWMGEPVASPAAHATISFPIIPPPDESDLAVTFYFTESAGGFLRVYWAGAKSSEMLSDNLYEGIAMPNQRTLLIKRATFSSLGTLNIQSSEASLNISRIHWEWVTPAPVSLASAATQSVLINATGGVLNEQDVDGAPPLPPPDQIQSSLVTAALTDQPERIEGGMEFVGTLQQAPQFGRLEVQMAGVPPGKTVTLWVNGATAGQVSLDLPDLSDPGYQQGAAGTPPSYIGWRKGSAYLPAGVLKPGDNKFQFTVQDATASTPLAVKDLLLQLKYPNTSPDTPSTVTTPDAPSAAAAVPLPDVVPAPASGTEVPAAATTPPLAAPSATPAAAASQ